jgi:hypothetical protein
VIVAFAYTDRMFTAVAESPEDAKEQVEDLLRQYGYGWGYEIESVQEDT